MKNCILIIINFLLVNTGLLAQNIECIGNPINISMRDYKIGSIQWQFSVNGQDWVDLAGETSTNLSYNVIETGYFRTKITYGECDYLTDSIKIDAYPMPTTADAGNDINLPLEDISVTLNGNIPVKGVGKWTVVSGIGGSFTDENNPNSIFTFNKCSDYVLRWSISTDCKVSSDEITLGFNTKPTASIAGPDQVFQNGDTITTLSANIPLVGIGKWTILNGIGGQLNDSTNPVSTFSGKLYEKYVLEWSVNTCFESTDTVKIFFGSDVPGHQIIDVDFNIYNTKWIGTQLWITENLKTTKYQNGDLIGTTLNPTMDIRSENSPKYEWALDGDENNVLDYGRLYTWYVVNDSRKICPIGWHVPTDDEWTILITLLGGEYLASYKLKEMGTAHWREPNFGATNVSGFTALPSGSRSARGTFNNNSFGVWWSSSISYDKYAFYRFMSEFNGDVLRYDCLDYGMNDGISIRCIKD